MSGPRLYLVRTTLRGPYGLSRAAARVVAAEDPIAAARATFDVLRARLGQNGKRPESFSVRAARDPATFMEDVGALTFVDDYYDAPTPLEAIEDLFEAAATEVRL